MNDPWTSTSAVAASARPHELHSGLTVRMIMTSRDELLACAPDETLAAVKKSNDADRFSFLPVVRDGRFLGLLHAQQWFDTEPPNEVVAERYVRLSEETLIGADASILDFVQDADRQPCRLVVSGQRIAGLVSLPDLQQLPVRAALFALMTGLELTMMDVIRTHFPETKAWTGLLSVGRQLKLAAQIEGSRKAEGHVDDLLFTQFCDKADIIRKGVKLGGGTRRLEQDFDAFQDLRDALAHANDYAATPEKAADVAGVVRRLFEVQSKLEQVAMPQ